MGLFDFFRRDRDGDPENGKPVDRKLAGLAKTAASKKAQQYDRDEAIRKPIEIGRTSTTHAEVKKGLDDGDVVLAAPTTS